MGITRRIARGVKRAWQHGWGQKTNPDGTCGCGDAACPIRALHRTAYLSWDDDEEKILVSDGDGAIIDWDMYGGTPWDEIAEDLRVRGFTHIMFEEPFTIDQFKVLVGDWRRC